MTSRFMAVLALGVSSSCGAPSGPGDPPTAKAEAAEPTAVDKPKKAVSAPEPAPEDLKAAVLRAERLGQAIYFKYMLAAWATNEIVERGIGKEDDRIEGWYVMRRDNVWGVHFVGHVGGRLQELHRLRYPRFLPSAVELTSHAKPLRVDEEGLHRFRARQIAKRSKFEPVAERYNTVVLPGPKFNEGEGLVVYMIGSSTDPGEMMVGGHYKIMVSADGKTLESTRKLSAAAMKIPSAERLPDGARASAPLVSHGLDPTPIETHVFASLVYRRGLFVGTDKGMWSVAQGSVHYLGPPPDRNSTGGEPVTEASSTRSKDGTAADSP